MDRRAKILAAAFSVVALSGFAQLPIRDRKPAAVPKRATPKPVSPAPVTPKPAAPDSASSKPAATVRPGTDAPPSHTVNLDATTPSLLQSLRARRFDTIGDDGELYHPSSGQGAGRTRRVRLPHSASQPTSPAVADDTPPTVLVRPAKTDDPANVIVAVVGGQRMTLKDLQDKLAMMPSRTAGAPKEKIEEQRRRYMSRILADWVETKLLALEAQSRGITVTDTEVDRYIEGTAKDTGMNMSVAARCRMLGISEKEFRKTIADAVLGENLIGRMVHDSVSDDNLRELVKEFPLLAWAPPRRQIRQIVYAFQADGNATIAETAKAIRAKERKMKQIRRRLAWFGGKFEDYREDPVKVEANKEPQPIYSERGWLTFGESINIEHQVIYQSVFQLKPPKKGKPPEYTLGLGEISDVIQSSYGFHILQVVAEEPSRQKTIDELRADAVEVSYDEVRRNLLVQLKEKYRDALRANPDGLLETELAAVGKRTKP